MSETEARKVTEELLDKEFVPVEKRNQCLQTALYELQKTNPFLGSTLQCMDIYYTHTLPTAGVMFNADAKKWDMAINPYWYCMKINEVHRKGILLHEMYHVVHKHPMRAPFLKINPNRRILMNIAMDMAINQYIPGLPSGCDKCPPLEEQMKGSRCLNEMCPGHCIDVKDYWDTDSKGKKTPWPEYKSFEFYYHKLIERFENNDAIREPKQITVEHVFNENIDVVANGIKGTKIITNVANKAITDYKVTLKIGDSVVVVAQDNPTDNGIYTIIDVGSATTPFSLKRHIEHNGTKDNFVYIGDAAIPKGQKVQPGKSPKAWMVTGQSRSEDSRMIDVDRSPITFEEVDVSMCPSPGGGKGLPSEFDSHHWEGNAEETEMLDATEELMKRAMQKQRLSYDDLPGFVKELLQDIDNRRAELNYKALILSAIKKHATGIDRKSTWARKSRRYGLKAPGTKVGELPKIRFYIDSSGSISIEEANEFLGISDEFLKVGNRKCNIGLFHTSLYYSQPYKLGQRFKKEDFQSGGTDLQGVIEDIAAHSGDLNVILTDGCYGDVDEKGLLPPNTKFPQCLFIISKDGSEKHPLERFGDTIKIPNTAQMKSNSDLEK